MMNFWNKKDLFYFITKLQNLFRISDDNILNLNILWSTYHVLKSVSYFFWKYEWGS
uniref:Uncharacterized protein n=1 Tax=Lepeophtheirus salmonis TaxID=72036 RepID=A0A0K2VK27_LEPSM